MELFSLGTRTGAVIPFNSCCNQLISMTRPEPFKYIKFPSVEEVDLRLTIEGELVTVSTKKPIKGVVLDADGEDVKWSDQAIDLVPGDPQTVKAVGLKGRKVKARFLGDGTA